jgi:hypothetical protein
MGDALFLHSHQRLGQGAGQGESGLRGEGFSVHQDVEPGGAFNPGHEHGVGEVGVLAEEVGVAGGGEDGAAAGAQAGEGGEGGHPVGLGDQEGGAEAGFEDFEGGLAGGGGVLQAVDDAGPSFLAIGEAGGGGVFGDAIGDAVNDQFVTGIGRKNHPLAPQSSFASEFSGEPSRLRTWFPKRRIENEGLHIGSVCVLGLRGFCPIPSERFGPCIGSMLDPIQPGMRL